MRVHRKIANPKLYEYLNKYTHDIIDRILTAMDVELKERGNKKLYYELEVAYRKDISKLKTIEEMPKRWYKYFEELEIERSIKNDNNEKGV